MTKPCPDCGNPDPDGVWGCNCHETHIPGFIVWGIWPLFALATATLIYLINKVFP